MSSSVIVKTYKSNNIPDVFILNYRALVGQELLFQITPPYKNISPTGTILTNSVASTYTLRLGDYQFPVQDINSPIVVKLNTPGIYPVSLQVNYKPNREVIYNIDQNITIYDKWPEYDITKTRVLRDNDIALPYTLEQTKIKPNEFGVADNFNSSILKLNECITYLKNYSTIIYNKTPTKYIGWLGIHKNYPLQRCRWYTVSDTPNLSKEYDLNLAAFTNIQDIKILGSEIYIVDKKSDTETVFYFSVNNRYFAHVMFQSEKQFLSQVKSIAAIEVVKIDDTTRALYIVDILANKIHKVTLYLNTGTLVSEFNVGGFLEQTIGGFGDIEDNTRFYSPIDIHYKDELLYVVDTNNKCIKKFTDNLGWLHKYFIEDFVSHQPISVIVTSTANRIQSNLIYILTVTNRVYILNQDGSIFNSQTPYIELIGNEIPKKIIFDSSEEFFYIIYNTRVEKYSILGLYINMVDELPETSSFVSGSCDLYHNIYIADQSRVYKFLDINEDFSIINKNFDSLYWQESDLLVDENEFVQDWGTNKSLLRVAHNAEIFRKSLHSRFGLTTVYSAIASLVYYTAVPISNAESIFCGQALENIGVGANELTLTQVLNRNIEKIYRCIESLSVYVKASYIIGTEGGDNCNGMFCWSWKSTSCFNVKLPVLRVCNINPITFKELKSDFTDTYAPSILWRDAFNECCSDK